MDVFSFFLSWPIQSKWSLYIWLKFFTTTPIIVMLGSISNLGYQYIHLTGFSSLLLALTWGMYRFFFFAVPSHSFFYAIKPLQNHSYRANPPEFFRWHWEIRTDTVQHPLTPSLDKKKLLKLKINHLNDSKYLHVLNLRGKHKFDSSFNPQI